VLVLTADKGLCGSFNTNIIKAATQFIVSNSDKKIVLGLIGRKGRDFFLRRGYQPAIDRAVRSGVVIYSINARGLQGPATIDAE